MTEIINILDKVYNLKDLSEEESSVIFNKIMKGELSDVIISSFLTALKIKGETLDEIIGATKILREKSLKINSTLDTVDTCGTGGDMLGTLNISTASAIVAASIGIKITKHGNRSVSSKSGSADVLESLGIKIQKDISKNEKMLTDINFCFMFAPYFHNAMKYVAPVRKELKTRTIFNLLGPLLNPANTKKQLLGVFEKKWLRMHAEVLKNLGSEHILLVNGFDGLDEISLSGKTNMVELKGNKISEYVFNPEEIGYELIDNIEIKGGNADFNADAIIKMLMGKHSVFQKIIEINAGATIYLSGKAKNIKDGSEIAKKAIDSRQSLSYLEELIKYTNSI
ncbi:MAG: anthranilate phosphoribosyltransferase [Pelagibacteraceae bacterium]|nr:anthranilate phosphoribosyltransferase [Pelagibacteraceae bacterium]|tara:strand:- start:23265 stop:24281 length:1017 start_codon:yes stop_codon:yes gene_type:complete